MTTVPVPLPRAGSTEITGDFVPRTYLFSPSHFCGEYRARDETPKRDARPFRGVSRRDASRRNARDATIALVC